MDSKLGDDEHYYYHTFYKMYKTEDEHRLRKRTLFRYASLKVDEKNFKKEAGRHGSPVKYESNDHSLHAAARDGNIDLVRLLLGKGTPPNIRNRINMQTPLHCAMQENHHEVAVLLLENGADVNATDDIYRTPLQIVSWNGDIDSIKILIEFGADVNTVDRGRNLVLEYPQIKEHAEELKDLFDNIRCRNIKGCVS